MLTSMKLKRAAVGCPKGCVGVWEGTMGTVEARGFPCHARGGCCRHQRHCFSLILNAASRMWRWFEPFRCPSFLSCLLSVGRLMVPTQIGLIQFCLSAPKTDMENNVVVSDYAAMDRILREERKYILGLCKKVSREIGLLLVRLDWLGWHERGSAGQASGVPSVFGLAHEDALPPASYRCPPKMTSDPAQNRFLSVGVDKIRCSRGLPPGASRERSMNLRTSTVLIAACLA